MTSRNRVGARARAASAFRGALCVLLAASMVASPALGSWTLPTVGHGMPAVEAFDTNPERSPARTASEPASPALAPAPAGASPPFAPQPLYLSNGAAQNFSPFAPSPPLHHQFPIAPNVDGFNVASLPSLSINQTGNLTVGFNGTWNPAPATAADRDWVLALIVRNGAAQAMAIEANTTLRVAINASQLPFTVYFGLPSTLADTGQVSTARVAALPPGGNLTVFNLSSANAGISLTGNSALPGLLTDSVWLNASGSYPGSGVLNATQSMVLFVPNDGGLPIEVRAARVTQWTNSSHFPGGRFLALKGGSVVIIGGSFRVSVWTRGSPESSLYLNATVNPTFAVRPDTLTVSGSVGNRSLEQTTSWNMTTSSLLSALNYNSVNCNQVIRLDNGSYRMFCSWQDNSGGGTSGVDSAWSPDGRVWGLEPGTRYSLCSSKYQINQISIIKRLDGTLRMYYGGSDPLLGCSALGSSTHSSSATSTNEGVTWTLENETLGTFSVTNPDALAVLPTAEGRLRMYLNSGSGLATALSDDGLLWASEATISASAPRQVYALASGAYKMYFGTTTVQSRLSANGLTWSGLTTEVPQWGAGDIEAGPILDRGDGVPLILVYSAASGLYVGTANQASPPGARVDVAGRLSDGTAFGATSANGGARGAFQLNSTVPAGAPLGRYIYLANAGFGENRFRGVVLNRVPTWTGPSDWVATEDEPLVINFTSFTTDPDVADTITVYPFSPYLNTSTATLLYPNGVLADTVFGIINDGHDNIPFTLSVAVIAVDDDPVLNLQPSYGAVEDLYSPVDFAGGYFDEETANASLTLSTNISGAIVNGSVIAFNFPKNGNFPATISVSDGNHTVSGTTVIVVSPVDDDPIVDLDSVYHGDEGTLITIDFTPFITDEDTPLSALTLEINLSNATVTGLSVSLQRDQPGSFPFEVTVSGGGAEVQALSLLVVDPTNDAPVWISPPALSGLQEDVPFSINLTAFASDEESASSALTYTMTSPYGAVVNGVANLTWPEGVLQESITFTVSDGMRSANTTVNVSIAPVNDPPALTNAPPSAYTGSGSLSFQFNVSDPDDAGGFTFELTSNESYISISPTGLLTITPPSDHGRANYSVRVRDASGATAGYVNFTLDPSTVPPPTTQTGEPFPWWLVLLIAAGAAALGAVVWRSRARAGVEVAPEPAPRPSAGAAPAAPPASTPAARQPPVVATVGPRKKFLVEDVFLLYRDGRTILSRTGIAADAVDDPESVGAMLVAVQDFVKDSFRKESPVDRMGYGDNVILLHQGEYAMLAVTVFGEPDHDFRDLLNETIRNIEGSYAGVIESWKGNRADFAGVESFLAPIWLLTAHLTRGDVLLATTAREVQMLSGVEFFQGFVRLKVGVVNNTSTVITNVTVDLDFNQDVLRLHRIEPTGYKFAGAKVNLGVLQSGEKATLAYYFDPQICTQSMIDGTARYKDAEGSQHVVQMKSRKAEVVCPLFFTKEQANTAMLRRLVETELNQFDVRAYSVAGGADPKELAGLFEAMKATVLAHDVLSVRAHERHNPYLGEGWFYGKTQVKGYQMIIRAAVDEEKGRVEFFVASTVMRSVTGLLAELNHQLQEVAHQRFPGLALSALFDEHARDAYADPKAVSKMIEGEAAAGETEAP